MCNVVHDEVVVQTKTTFAPKVQKELLKAMSKAGKVFCTTVPIEADAQISDHHTH
jgi:DNA polymerase I-like protein with 3'-5' exonuclease and polymerase domains